MKTPLLTAKTIHKLIQSTLAGGLWFGCASSSFGIEAILIDDNYVTANSPASHANIAGLKVNTVNSANLTFSLENLAPNLQPATVVRATLKVFVSAIRKPGDLAVKIGPTAGTPIQVAAADRATYVTSNVTQIVRSQIAQSNIRFDLTTTNADVTIDSKENAATSNAAVLEIDLRGDVAIADQPTDLALTEAFTDVPNLTVTIVTTGRPVFIGLARGTVTSSNYTDDTGSPNQRTNGAVFNLVRDASVISTQQILNRNFQGIQTQEIYPVGLVSIFDVVGAGTHTFKVQARKQTTSGSSVNVSSLQLVAYEL